MSVKKPTQKKDAGFFSVMWVFLYSSKAVRVDLTKMILRGFIYQGKLNIVLNNSKIEQNIFGEQ